MTWTVLIHQDYLYCRKNGAGLKKEGISVNMFFPWQGISMGQALIWSPEGMAQTGVVLR
nr:hypothetical protein Iba_chr05bCG0760 [Ipomoea batatas]